MKNIRFETKKDYQDALEEMCLPLKNYYSPGKALLMIGHTGTHYGERTAELEGFSRVLWGLVPLWYGGGRSCLDEWIPEGIRHGTNPEDEEYWGNYTDGEQAYVEMAALAFAVWMTPEKVWEPLSPEERDNFSRWIGQINTHKISDNNWLFFRVLVNCALEHVGAEYDKEQLEKDLSRIDDFYLGDGWYSDGDTKQRDYYIGFAMHFYSLIYAKLMENKDAGRSAKYRERSRLFAQDFIYWFGDRGEALPYGRSLTYRFAQAGFWCGLAFADVEAFPWGVIKGIVNRHFRYWFSQPVLDAENKLTLGYTYPNLAYCEGYNAPNSPYWSWKSFLVLALPESHPFWSSKEEEMPELASVKELPYPWMIMQRNRGYVTALTSGQYAEWEPVHVAEKFEKFAYSSYFGFQVPRSYYNLAQAAPDNMLAFCRDGYYFVRRRCDEVRLDKENGIYSKWRPMEGICVETTLKPCKEGHLRTHVIHADFACEAVEGGFALPYHEPFEVKGEDGSAAGCQVTSTMGSSSITLREGKGVGEISFCEADVNLLYPRTVLPLIRYEIPEGETRISVYVEGNPA